MQTVEWAAKPVSVTSLLEVIQTSDHDRKTQPSFYQQSNGTITKSSCIVCTVKDAQPPGKNGLDAETRGGRPKVRKFLDSDNILLSVFEHESRRKRETTPVVSDLLEDDDSTSSSQSPASLSFNNVKRKTKKISVSIPSSATSSVLNETNEKPNQAMSASSRKSTAKLQYSHRSIDESSKNLANSSRLASLMNTLPTDDTIDIVVAANDPEQRFSASSNNSSPLVKISSAGSLRMREKRVKNKLSSSGGGAAFERVKTSDIRSQSVFGLHTTNEPDDDVETVYGLDREPDVALIPTIRSSQDGDKRNRNKTRASYHYSVDPNLNRNAYMRALRDARNKYFKHVPLDKSITKPFEFSYCNLLNRGGSAGCVLERRLKKPYGMKRIFGEIKPDDYYPISRSKSEQK